MQSSKKREQLNRRIGSIVTVVKCVRCRKTDGMRSRTHHCHTPPKKDYSYRPYKKQPLPYHR